MPRKLIPCLLIMLPATFLFVCFALPNAFLLTASFLESEGQVLTSTVTLENYARLFQRATYVQAMLRTFAIGAMVGALVVVISYPLAFFLSRTTSRWKEVLMALSLAPLLASVVVRTYGWWVIFNREGVLNDALRALGLIELPYAFLPSTGAIVVGLTHSLLPYGVITILTALNGVNPRLEQAAMSLGASRTKTFFAVTLPLSTAGITGAFLLAFALAISAYATPQILGGAATPVMATQIYNLMLAILDWSVGSAMAMVLIVSAGGLMLLGSIIGGRGKALPS